MLKQIISVFITFLGLFFLVAPVFAQSDQEIAKKYGITFPIAELGNCTSISSCKTFCDDFKNHQSCTDFAQKHNLTSDSSTTSPSKSDEEILKLATVELGCSTIDECMAFCDKEENMEKCIDFAARHGLGGSNGDQMKQVISSLKQQFGCSSMTSCMNACNQPDNAQKCMEIFKQAGFDTGGSYSNEPPEVWCPKISSECKWDGKQCVCEGPQTCSKSPGCSWNGQFCNCGGGSSVNESGEVWCPKIGQNCTWDGSQCVCPGTATQTSSPSYQQEPPEVWCPKAAQSGQICSWNGTSCNCWDPKSCTSPCTWTGSKCDCPAATAEEPPEVWCPKNPGCKWTGETCLCEPVLVPQTSEPSPSPAVQGASTNRGLLQQILDFILGR